MGTLVGLLTVLAFTPTRASTACTDPNCATGGCVSDPGYCTACVSGFYAKYGNCYAGTPGVASAASSALDSCQNAVRAESAKFVKSKVAALDVCLKTISGQLLRNNAVGVTNAAKPCADQLRKLYDSRGLGKSLGDQLAAGIHNKCDVVNVTDITGEVVGLPEQIKTANINDWCSSFTGNPAITTVDEWIACLVASAECSVDTAIVAQYPRVLEWLAAVRGPIDGLPDPAGDPTKAADALVALDTLYDHIDGADSDGEPSLQCGDDGQLGTCTQDLQQCGDDLIGCSTSLVAGQNDLTACNTSLVAAQNDVTACNLSLVAAQNCGNGAIDAGEVCDQGNLNGHTCSTQGFDGGTLTCGSGCTTFDTSGCSSGADRFVDNGSTVLDKLTGREWEKKVATCPAGYSASGTYATSAPSSGTFNVSIDGSGTSWTGFALDTTFGPFLCSGTVTGTSLTGSCLGGTLSGTIDCALSTVSITLTGLVNGSGSGSATGPNNPHEVYRRYTWSDNDGAAPDGAAFLDFLARLNGAYSGACFADHCDWRLPTKDELLSIVDFSLAAPKINPVFGATESNLSYWSASTDGSDAFNAFVVPFSDGIVQSSPKTTGLYVRAVRGDP